MLPPFNFKKWIDDNRHLLKPPVGNQVVYKDTEFIVMVVGGPNARKDFHFNKGEELFYQIEGDMQLPIRENGKTRIIDIKEGDLFLLPPMVEHSPQRFPNTVGIVIERMRTQEELDAYEYAFMREEDERARIDQAKKDGKYELVIELHEDGMPIEKIAKLSKMTIDEVKKVIEDLTTN